MFILTLLYGKTSSAIVCGSEDEARDALDEHLHRNGRYLNERGAGMIFELIPNPLPGQRGRRVGRYTITPA